MPNSPMDLLTKSGLGPFKEKTFRALWIGAFISNIGTWMQNIGVSWIAAAMSGSPLLISLVQVASSLPSLFLSYPAGVIADHTDKRKLLIGLQLFSFLVLFVLSILTVLHLLNMYVLISFTLLVGIGSALTTPVWQAVTPEVVSAPNMKSAIALNGVSFNLSRAIGPAIGGVVLAYGGIQAIFLFNALSFLALTAGLRAWRNERPVMNNDQFDFAFKEGIKEVSNSRNFRQLIVRTIAFTMFVSAIFALVPHLSKYEWHQTGTQYTLLWVALGSGAMAGSLGYAAVTRIFRSYQVIAGSCFTLGACIFLLGYSKNIMVIYSLLILAGAAWIYSTSTLNVLAQLYSPKAYKGRFLAINVTIFQGFMALSSLFWGFLSVHFSTISAMELCGGLMVMVSIALAFFPMEEPGIAVSHQVPCTDPILISTDTK